MKKILIASLKAGAGHMMAAKAIEDSLLGKNQDFEVKNIDFLEYATVLSQDFYGKWYLDMINKVPQFYGWLYDNLDDTTKDARLIFDRINTQKFKEFVFDYEPDLVIATHFVPADILIHWRTKYKKNYKVVVTVTDYEAHRLWANKEADHYYVATPEIIDQLEKFDVKSENVSVTGIPIDSKYSSEINKDEVRNKLNLNQDFTILVASGGFGIGPVEEIVRRLHKLPQKLNILIMTGNNEELLQTLNRIPDNENHNKIIFPFIDNDQELMAISDIIIGKPGGLTTAEALAIGTPIVIIDPIPGQEVANANFLCRNLAGLRADDLDEVINITKQLFNRPDIFETLTKNTKKVALPDAAKDIIHHALNLIN